jgi:glutathione S-transferase
VSGEAASGLPARGYSWPPFEKGNDAALRHGAYALLKLTPRAEELAAALRELVPAYAPSLEPGLQAAGMVGAQCEAAGLALAEASPGDRLRLEQDFRAWLRLWLRYLESFGMTSLSQARLGLELVQAKGAAAAAYLTEKRATEQAERDEPA